MLKPLQMDIVLKEHDGKKTKYIFSEHVVDMFTNIILQLLKNIKG